MQWQALSKAAALVSGTIAPIMVSATTYYTVEQVQDLLFPGASFHKVAINMTPDQIKQLKKQTGIYHPFKADHIYKVNNNEGWLIIDQVYGKHEMVTYAVALTPNGAIKQIEVMQYNESYGGQVRNKSWRDQFTGKTVTSSLELDKDIKNISGATLSSKHLTEGVRRILLVHQLLTGNSK